MTAAIRLAITTTEDRGRVDKAEREREFQMAVMGADERQPGQWSGSTAPAETSPAAVPPHRSHLPITNGKFRVPFYCLKCSSKALMPLTFTVADSTAYNTDGEPLCPNCKTKLSDIPF